MTGDDPFSRLTELQRACLELLLQHYQIKEIAQKLGVSVSSVNQRLDRARKLLGAPNSYAAARMMAEHDGRNGTWIPPTGYENTVPGEAATSADVPANPGSADDGRLADIGYAGTFPAGPVPGGSFVKWPFPTAGRSDNDLSAISRTLWVLPIAVISLALLVIVALLSVGAQDVIVRLQHSIARLH